jgi:hypothetical protein
MNAALYDTIFYVTGKEGIESSSHDELKNMIAENPYFAPAQLVYAAKLKADNGYQLQTQIQKTGLFFNNFRWLQYQLAEVDYNKFKSGVVDENTLPTTVDENNIEAVKTETPDFIANMNIPTVEEVKNLMSGIDDRREEAAAVENFEEIATPQSYQEIEETNNAHHQPPIILDNKDETAAVENFEEIATPQPYQEVEETNNVHHQPPMILDIKDETAAVENEEEIITHNNRYDFDTIAAPISPVLERHNATETIAAVENDIHAEIAALKANWHKTHNEPATHFEESIQQNESIDIVEVTEEKEFKINTEIPNLRANWDKPIETFANAPLPFETEPYYTIDYFASQGIKFDYSKEPHDKLTTKMLKFTDWLKKMKGIKPENVIVEDDPELEKAITNIAAASNQTKEIVTETMAEIFAKQGKTEKAIQLYIKLSFLIPDKTTYFATKIKELKGI